MTDDDYVAELRSYGMLSTNQAADRIEALTAERDEARKKFDDTDLCWNGFAPCGWSLTLIDKADTAEAERDRLRVSNMQMLGDIAVAMGRIEALTAERDRLREALEQFLIEYDEVDLANAEPSSLTEAVLEARAALKGETP